MLAYFEKQKIANHKVLKLTSKGRDIRFQFNSKCGKYFDEFPIYGNRLDNFVRQSYIFSL